VAEATLLLYLPTRILPTVRHPTAPSYRPPTSRAPCVLSPNNPSSVSSPFGGQQQVRGFSRSVPCPTHSSRRRTAAPSSLRNQRHQSPLLQCVPKPLLSATWENSWPDIAFSWRSVTIREGLIRDSGTVAISPLHLRYTKVSAPNSTGNKTRLTGFHP